MANEIPLQQLPLATFPDPAVSPGTSRLSSPAVTQIPTGVSLQSTSSRTTGSVSFADMNWQNGQSGTRNENQSSATQERGSFGPQETQSKIYWRSLASMVACFFLGIFTALGHHIYYNYFTKDVVGNTDEQQRKLR
jgi:hypothetical protein